MALVSARPDLMVGVAQDLAALERGWGQAATAASTSAEVLAAAGADEVSVAIAETFATFGRQFQAVTVAASASYTDFARTLVDGAGAYAATEARNVAQAMQSAIGRLAHPGGAAVGATADILGPYTQLFSNTSANLEALRAAMAANPAPFLRQFLANQTRYAAIAGAAIENTVTHFPGNVPVAFDNAAHNLAAIDPAAFLRFVGNSQLSVAETIVGAAFSSGEGFLNGLQALPGSVQGAFQALQTGNVGGAVADLLGGAFGLLSPGFDATTVNGVVNLHFGGILGSWLQVLRVPSDIAQDIAYLLPPGSIEAQIGQHIANLLAVPAAPLMSVGLTGQMSPVSWSASINYNVFMGLLLDFAGAPVNGISAFGTSVTALGDALAAGTLNDAIEALATMPAVVADGYLNGHMTLPISFPVGNLGLVNGSINLPMSGLLVGPTPSTLSFSSGSLQTSTVITGTPLGGFVPALLTYVPQLLADAIGA